MARPTQSRHAIQQIPTGEGEAAMEYELVPKAVKPITLEEIVKFHSSLKV